MKRLIAVDPGDAHVGVAFFEAEGDGQEDASWECVDTQEMSPEEFENALLDTFLDGDIDILVYEKFRLYADKAKQQTGSEFPTAQLIGVIKYLHRMHEIHATKHDEAEAEGKRLTCELEGGTCADPWRRTANHITLVKQPADIKKPTTGILRTKKIKSTAKRNGDKLGHQVDAELHGWYYIMKGRHKDEQRE